MPIVLHHMKKVVSIIGMYGTKTKVILEEVPEGI